MVKNKGMADSIAKVVDDTMNRVFGVVRKEETERNLRAVKTAIIRELTEQLQTFCVTQQSVIEAAERARTKAEAERAHLEVLNQGLRENLNRKERETTESTQQFQSIVSKLEKDWGVASGRTARSRNKH